MTTTLKNELTAYEDFVNLPDGQDCYIAPIFGNAEINDYNDEFAKIAARREVLYNIKQGFDCIKYLVGGVALALIGTSIVKMAISAYKSAQTII